MAEDAESRRLLEQARRLAAATHNAVLIRGESGTGKQLLAAVVHYLSPRAGEPLLRVDCAGLPQEIAEAELFGEEARPGWLERAGAGTLVLDEIGALSMAAQGRLLRAIEERVLERGGRQVRVEARVIALTTVDLERAVARRSLREDLYYRLNAMPLEVAPLRRRPADLKALLRRMLDQLCEQHRRPRMEVAAEAERALEAYSYPGNASELRGLLERVVTTVEAPQIELQDLPPQVRCAADAAAQRKMSLEQLEKAHIAEVLDHCRGKKTRAAQILGISRKTLLEKRKRYGFD